jgi:hypothetical protein
MDLAVAMATGLAAGAGVTGLGGATGFLGAGVAGRAGVTSARYWGDLSKANISSLSKASATNSLACFISASIAFHFLAFASSSNGSWIGPLRFTCFGEAGDTHFVYSFSLLLVSAMKPTCSSLCLAVDHFNRTG